MFVALISMSVLVVLYSCLAFIFVRWSCVSLSWFLLVLCDFVLCEPCCLRFLVCSFCAAAAMRVVFALFSVSCLLF